MPSRPDISSQTINRLSIYLRCLRQLERSGVGRISSLDLARRFHLSAPQIRKDLAHFGEFGIRGVGYQVDELLRRIERLLGLDHERRAVIVGAGNLGTALARFPGFNSGSFRVVALFDVDPARVGPSSDHAEVHPSEKLASVVATERASIGILTVPSTAAQENYDALVAAGIQAVLNFAPIRLRTDPTVTTKNVDLLIFLEELAYFLSSDD